MVKNSMSNNKSVADLWKNEKSTYRIWIIAFGIALIVSLIFFLASFIYDLLNKDAIIQTIIKHYTDEKKNPDQIKQLANNDFIIWHLVAKSLLLIGFFGCIAFFALGVYDSYKKQNFKYLNNTSITIGFVIAYYSFFSLLYSLFFRNYKDVSSIINIIFYCVSAIFMLSTISKVSRIRRIFISAEYFEKMSKDPQFQELQKKLNEISAMAVGGRGPSYAENTNLDELSKKQSKDVENDEETDKYQKAKSDLLKAKERKSMLNNGVSLSSITRLEKLPIDRLKIIAKKLSISGYEKMTKDELVRFIVRITK